MILKLNFWGILLVRYLVLLRDFDKNLSLFLVITVEVKGLVMFDV